jgi:hypothetical protein
MKGFLDVAISFEYTPIPFALPLAEKPGKDII